MNLAVVLNSDARVLAIDGGQIAATIRDTLHELGAAGDVLLIPRAQLEETLERVAHDSQIEAVLVGGGDGTINTAARIMTQSANEGRQKPMGILPLGTFNLVARDLRIPLEVAPALRVLLTGQTRQIDYADVNGHVFLHNSTIGILTTMMHQREIQRGNKIVKLVGGLVRSAWSVLFRDPPVTARLEYDNQSRPVSVKAIVVSVNSYREHPALFPSRTCIDCGQLSIYLAHQRSPLEMLRLAAGLALGAWRSDARLEQFDAQQVVLHSQRSPLKLVIDGEVVQLTPPLVYHLHPRGLTVLAPPQPDAAQKHDGHEGGT